MSNIFKKMLTVINTFAEETGVYGISPPVTTHSWHQFHTFHLIKRQAFPSGIGCLVDKLCWRAQQTETAAVQIFLEMPAANNRCFSFNIIKYMGH